MSQTKQQKRLPHPTTDQIKSQIQTLGLPNPTKIEPLSESQGEYHSIYMISFASDADIHPNIHATDGSKNLVLRLSGTDFPTIKTINEVAVMTWIRQNTNIPIPLVVAHSASANNVLGCEFSLLEHCPGKLLSEIGAELSSQDKVDIIDQIIDFLCQLRSKIWKHVGGLRFEDENETENERFLPGPMIQEQFWHANDKNFSDPLSLNPYGPFEGFASYSIGQVQKFQETVNLHASTQSLRDLPIPKLLDALQSPSIYSQLDSTTYTLAHRDLHLGNILYSLSYRRITAVLDWELAAVVPYQLWNPGNFLWNPSNTVDVQQKDLMKLFYVRVKEKGVQYLIEDAKRINEVQELVQRAILRLKWLINGRIRGWERNKGPKYRTEFEACVQKLVDLKNDAE